MPPFVPSPDVAAILHTLLDIYERREKPPSPLFLPQVREGSKHYAIRCDVHAMAMPEQLLCYNLHQPLIGDGDERANIVSDSFLRPVRLGG